jgi:hypothetical protein
MFIKNSLVITDFYIKALLHYVHFVHILLIW